MLATFLGAWLFLPMATIKITEGLPGLDKTAGCSIGFLVGAIIADSRRLTRLRLSALDIPMAVLCLCPIASSLSNDLGLYDGLSTAFRQCMIFGVPYLAGRIYFKTADDIRGLAIALLVGGLIYAPLCLFEIKMSPQLHRWVYGYHQHSFGQTIRFGGYRPMVFMYHGLMVGLWMSMTALIGSWLAFARCLPTFLMGFQTRWLLLVLCGTAILCKSTGALVLLAVGLITLILANAVGTRVLVWLLMLVAPVYITARATGLWSGDLLIAISNQTVGQERAESLQFRMKNEDMLGDKALARPVFGWGGWNRARVFDEDSGRDLTVTDGMWIITLGNTGVVGVTAWMVSMLAPAAMVFRRFSPATWTARGVAPQVVLAMVAVLVVIDGVPNAMNTTGAPVYVIIVGSLVSFLGCPIRYAQIAPVPEHIGGTEPRCV